MGKAKSRHTHYRTNPEMTGKVGEGGNTKATTPKPPPANSSPRFNLLVRKDVGDLTVAHLNVDKIGKFKIKALC